MNPQSAIRNPQFKVVVCIKVVPRPEEVKVDEATMTLSREHVRSMMNPPDFYALEEAISMKEKLPQPVEVTAITMGPPLAEPYLRIALMMGADRAVLITDRAFAGADTLATSYTLAKAIEKLGGADLVVCGEESSDGATAQVPPGIAEWLNWTQITYARTLSITEFPSPPVGEGKGGGKLVAWRELGPVEEQLEASLPAVVSVTVGSSTPRFLAEDRMVWAQTAPITKWGAGDLSTDPALIGLTGSPTRVEGLKRVKTAERKRRQIKGPLEAQVEALASLLRPV
jgi:electron transfer flavoprotein beta subunit